MATVEQKKTLKRVSDILGTAIGLLETVRDEMNDEFSEKSEEWQEGEKGEAAQTEIDTLNDAIDTLESLSLEP